MATIVELLANWLARRSEPVPLDARYERTCEPLIGFLESIGRLIQFVANSPPSLGYEPLLCAGGCDLILARAIAMLMVRIGKRRATEGKRQTGVFAAFLFLAKPHRHPNARARRAKVLIAAWQETSIIETALDKVGIDVSEFVKLLHDAARGLSHQYSRLQEIALAIVRSQSPPMGPKMTAQSISMEYFLDHFPNYSKRPQAFGRKRPDGDSDLVAEATRREFGLAQFDGRPARRRIKRAMRLN
jgi:hypothetical protein